MTLGYQEVIRREPPNMTHKKNWISSNFKTFVLWTSLLKEWKDKLQTGKNIFANHMPEKGLVIYKELSKLNTKKTNSPVKNGQNHENA